jgi:hypothetical protein
MMEGYPVDHPAAVDHARLNVDCECDGEAGSIATMRTRFECIDRGTGTPRMVW